MHGLRIRVQQLSLLGRPPVPLELTRTVGADPTPPLLRSLALATLTRSDFAATTQFGQLLPAAGERGGDAVLIVEAGYVLGVAAFWQRTSTPRVGISNCRSSGTGGGTAGPPDPVRPGSEGGVPEPVGQHPVAPRAARRGARRPAGALAWAAEIAHPYSIAVARTFGALLALRGQAQNAVTAVGSPTYWSMLRTRSPSRVASRIC